MSTGTCPAQITTRQDVKGAFLRDFKPRNTAIEGKMPQKMQFPPTTSKVHGETKEFELLRPQRGGATKSPPKRRHPFRFVSFSIIFKKKTTNLISFVVLNNQYYHL